MNQLSEKELHTHVPIVGWLNIVTNGAFLLLGLLGSLLLSGSDVFADSHFPVLFVLTFTALVALLLLAALALLGMLAGYGLLRRKKWGQILGIVVGGLSLLNIPLGTALGAYTLFVLFQNSANAYFAGEEAEPA